MPSRVVGRTVLSGVEAEEDETECGLVGVLTISVVGVTDEVEDNGFCVETEV